MSEDIPLDTFDDKNDDDGDDPGPSGEGDKLIPDDGGKGKGKGKGKGSKTAETSFTIDNILTNQKIKAANLKLEQMFTEYGKNGKVLTLVVDEGRYKDKVVVAGPRGGKTPLFTSKGEINSKLPKNFLGVLGPSREELIDGIEKKIKDLKKKIQEDRLILEDKHKDPAERERARERIRENEKLLSDLENERDAFEEKPSLRERVKNIFKRYGFTVTAILLAVGLTIGVIVDSLTSGLKSVAKGVGNGLKDLGKKVSQILPGLIGSIVSFIFRTAGSVIGFLGKNAWLLILGVVIFAVEEFQKRNR